MSEESLRFRRVLGHYPTGVCAVTAMANSQPVGMTIGSFTSASLDPPLIAFFPDRTSSSWSLIQAAGTFCVNVLSDRQHEVCKALASKDRNKFQHIAFHLSDFGAPVIDGTLAQIDCELAAIYDAGDHHIALGRVHGLNLGSEGGPLIFYKGGFSRAAPI